MTTQRIGRLAVAAGLVLAAGCASRPAPAPASVQAAPQLTLYERVAAQLAARPDLDEALGAPPPELAAVGWMIGRWEIEATVFATASAPESADHGTGEITRILGGTWFQFTDTYPEGIQDLGFLTFNPVTRRWVSLGLDSTGNAVIATGTAWEGNRLVLSAPGAVLVGIPVDLRQTVEKIDDDTFELRNEERLADGTWHPLDRYRYRRARG